MTALKYTPQLAETIARKAGFTPTEPYPGLARLPWRAVCNECGAPRSIRVTSIVLGRILCQHKRRTLSKAEQKDLVDKYKEQKSLTVRALAKEYRVGYGSVHRLLSDAGVLRERGGDMRSRRTPE